MSIAKIERPLIVIAVVSVLIPLKVYVGPLGIALFEIPLAGLMICWLFRACHKRSWGLDLWSVTLIGLAIWMFISAVYVGSGNEALAKLSVWSGGVLLGLYARWNYRQIFGAKLLVTLALVVVSTQAVVGILQFVTYSSVGNVTAYFGQTASTETLKGGSRLVGTVGHPNLLGNWLNISMVFLLFGAAVKLRTRGGGREMLVWWLGLLIILLTISRFNIALALLAPLSLFLLRRQYPTKFPWDRSNMATLTRKILCRTVIVVALAGVGLATRGYLSSQVQRTVEVSSDRFGEFEESAYFRLAHLGLTVQSVRTYPLFGLGFDRSKDIFASIKIDLFDDFNARTHNIFLLLAAEGGIPAALLFILVLLMPVVRYGRHMGRFSPMDHALGVACLVYILCASMYLLPATFKLWPYFLFLLGCFVSVSRRPTGAEREQLY